MLDLVIFDCDGVLINSEEIILDTEIAFVEKFVNFKIDKEDFVGKFTGLAEDKWIDAIHQLQDPPYSRPILSEDLDSLKDQMHRLVMKHVRPVTGISNFLERSSVPACVASNSGFENLKTKLKTVGLIDFFKDNIFSADQVSFGKPEPDLFIYAAKQMGVSPDRCLVIEDSSNGVKAARTAGMKVLGFIGGGHCSKAHGDILMACGADMIIKHFSEIYERGYVAPNRYMEGPTKNGPL